MNMSYIKKLIVVIKISLLHNLSVVLNWVNLYLAWKKSSADKFLLIFFKNF